MALAIAAGGGCADDEATGPGGTEVTNLDGEAWLSEVDPLFDGAPDNAKLPEEGKADATYPPRFTELLATQTPVRNQSRRGVCSIFSAIGLMEHLYVLEGTLPTPDFSEQYLQWSTKVEVGAFRNTDGSSARVNIDAIHRFGVPEEQAWPYEPTGWAATNDPECTGGKEQPTKCYTNGEPPMAATAAKKWRLPQGRWINASPRSIKAHMMTKKQAATVGLKFFYQAWNHRSSTLPTNNEYWRQGYVTYPNAEDVTESEKKPAGHEILLVGWDDELTVQRRDGKGTLLVDAQGQPLVDKGFFIFKNSWGTGSFGVQNPHGDGYGFISMEYVREYGTVYVSDLPEVVVDEVCNDGKDNDGDQQKDCADPDCAAAPACAGGTITGSNTTPQDIPDNSAAGIRSEIVVAETGTITALSVSVDITHTYQGDLTVKLEKGGTSVILHEKTGGSADNIQRTFSVPNFNGQDAAGTWTLVVVDSARGDAGRLNSFALQISTEGTSGKTSYSSDEAVPIPDQSPAGIFTNIEVPQGGTIKGLTVDVDITHPYKGDLTIKLQRVGVPTEAVLQAADNSSGAFEPKSYTVSTFNGEDAAGTWRLVVADTVSQDQGKLNGWRLEIAR